jgi:hypothetical protein
LMVYMLYHIKQLVKGGRQKITSLLRSEVWMSDIPVIYALAKGPNPPENGCEPAIFQNRPCQRCLNCMLVSKCCSVALLSCFEEGIICTILVKFGLQKAWKGRFLTHLGPSRHFQFLQMANQNLMYQYKVYIVCSMYVYICTGVTLSEGVNGGNA